MMFEDGKGYIATNTIDPKRKVVVVPAGRNDDGVVFARVDELSLVHVQVIDGCETAMIRLSDGDWFTSAAVEVGLENVGRVLKALPLRRY